LSSLGLISVGWWRLHFDVFKTDVGEVRRVLLSDNSSLLLNTASRVSVRMTSTLREVQLAEGEALFEVARDVDRPFIVRVGNISVRALGTAFSVRAFDSKTQVTVEEGTVELSAGNRAAAQIPTRLSANETASETDRGIQVRAVSPEEIVRRLAWRDGRLAFAGESLARAVAEINRHNRRLIHIDDPALAARPVVGLFRTADPAGFARTIATALGVESVEGVDGIHLRPNPAL
jgi:transmembrane sensor